MSRVDVAVETNKQLKRQKRAVSNTIPQFLNDRMVASNNDQSKARVFVAAIGDSASFLSAREWEVGMLTTPGEVVYDPNKDFEYVFSAATEMIHANPLFYPGAAGVYHWAIIPKTKDEIKIYPNIQGIIVAVKQGEFWYDVNEEHIYSWKGQDNPNCVWPPVAGNEWELIT